MKKYDVYGMGNALLDIEYEVTPELLQELGIDKGVMTLIDADCQSALMQRLGAIPHKRSSGGSAANTIVAIAQFGGSCFYSCKVAADEFGTSYLQDLEACRVATNLTNGDREDGTTGQCLVFVTPDADRTMNTFLGISSQFSQRELLPEAVEQAEYLYIEGYLVTGDGSKAAAVKAREVAQAAGTRVALSLSDFNMAKFFKPGFLEMIGAGIDAIFANESEALTMAESENLDDAIAYLKTLSKTFAITRGARGSLIFDGETLLEIAPVKVKAVDTVGAGDMYAGAVLYGLTHGMDYAQAGKLGSLASAQLVTNLGPRMEADAVKALLMQV
ncbi:sugar kinase, ribokinase family [Rubidibacter lacunae KORDI 51-2]|uniref:Sugar kinase, ribokinase family n=1 Tax=Rubidibacter lacunae KORDI 51-2 TaxID=582515 RepID=U5DFZ2_9CHRO|nr:adenosine kinase [Rubidibacter lacunae]ERN40177.1 sugar kinase, ribokinase family [Rubidibacter lacunae KORDI 51-2]